MIDAALSRSKIKDLPGYVVTATLKPGAPIGELKAKLTIVSDHPQNPKAEVPVTATIRGNLDRAMFFLGIVKKGKEAVSKVTISTVSKDPSSISKIDCSLGCVSVAVKPETDPSTSSRTGGEYVLTATVNSNAPLGNIKGEVTVYTNDPDQPEIKIPVYAYIEK